MNLKYYRELAGFDVESAATALEIKTLTLYRYEAGDVKVPVNVFLRMCALYSVDAFELANESRFPSSSLSYMTSLLFALDKVSPNALTLNVEDSERLKDICGNIDACISSLIDMVRSIDPNTLRNPNVRKQYEEVVRLCQLK